VISADFGAAKKTVAKPVAKKLAPVASDKTANKRLQAALATLGKIAKSPSLSAIKADGALGPKTVAAVNLAFTKHLGPGQAPAELRTGALTLAFIATNANSLAGLIETEVRRRGVAPASPTTVAKATAIQSVTQAPTATPANAKASAKRLQAALVALGKVTGSAKLKVAVDGAPGKATAAAVNWAFIQHIGVGQAPAAYRTGQLTVEYIKSNADALATVVEAEVKRRASSPAVAAPSSAVTKQAVRDLQIALVNLGKAAGSAQLKAVKADGALGPATVNAVNLAFTKHIGPGQADASLRTGRLTLADVKANITPLIQLIFKETRRRGAAAMIPTTAPIPVKNKSGKTVMATKVQTASGTTYKVKDPETNNTYFTTDPTTAEPEPIPGPEPTPEQEAVAAQASAESGGVVEPKRIDKKAAARAADDVIAPSLAPPSDGGGVGPGTGVTTTPGGDEGGGGGGEGGESVVSKYKFALIGGGLLLAGGIGFLALRKRGGSTSSAPTRSFQPSRKMVRA
jgi:hypothetical protein